jgi:hypothetical protein
MNIHEDFIENRRIFSQKNLQKSKTRDKETSFEFSCNIIRASFVLLLFKRLYSEI